MQCPCRRFDGHRLGLNLADKILRFRYVECHLNELRRCAFNKSHITKCLRSLPRDLDETYERLLYSVDDSCIDDVRRIFTLVCFSGQPLTMEEVRHAHAVHLDNFCLDLDERLLYQDGLLEMCGELIEVVEVKDHKKFVRIPHFSVQEYLESARIRQPDLESGRIRQQKNAARFALQQQYALTEMTQICLVYLLDPELSSGELDEAKLDEFPIALYAAKFWGYHYGNVSIRYLKLKSLRWSYSTTEMIPS